MSLRDRPADHSAEAKVPPVLGRRVSGPGPRTRLFAWGPVVAWAAVIFALSSVPSLSTGLGTWDLVLRKLAHLVEFAILGALLIRALRREPTAILIGAAYAASDEIHQSFVRGREGSPLDWLVDVIGVTAGVLLLTRRRP